MTIKIGESIPDSTLYESTQFGDVCPLSPEKVSVAAATKGKRVVIFGLPGAYTPTCSAKHVPGYVQNADALRAKGVDEIWCISVNDGFVMAAWGREALSLASPEGKTGSGKVRFLGDGSAELAKKLGLELDLTGAGMGMRMQRFSLFVDDGIVKQVNVEGPGKFEVSTAETMLGQL